MDSCDLAWLFPLFATHRPLKATRIKSSKSLGPGSRDWQALGVCKTCISVIRGPFSHLLRNSVQEFQTFKTRTHSCHQDFAFSLSRKKKRFGSKSQASPSVPLKTRGSVKKTLSYLCSLKVRRQKLFCPAVSQEETHRSPGCPWARFAYWRLSLNKTPQAPSTPPSARESHSETKGQLFCPRRQGANLPVSVYQREGC